MSKKLFNNKLTAAVAAILFSLDFVWFTTSCLAVPETIFASLLLLSSYFFISFLRKAKNNQPAGEATLFIQLVYEKVGSSLKAIAFFYNPVVLWGSLVSCTIVLWEVLKKRKISAEKLF